MKARKQKKGDLRSGVAISASFLTGSTSDNMQADNGTSLYIFIAFALLLHIPLYFVPNSWLFDKVVKHKNKHVVYVSRLSRQGPRRYKRVKRRNRKFTKHRIAKKKKPKKRPKPRKPDGQFVDVAPTPDDRPLKKTRFLSEYNTRVKKQTISRHRRLKYKIAMAKPTRRKKRNSRRLKARSRRLAMRIPQRLRINHKPTKQKKVRKQKRHRPSMAIPKVNRQRRAAVPKSKHGTQRSHRTRPQIQGRGRRLSLNLGPRLKLDPSLQPMPNTPNMGRGTHTSPPPSIDLRPNAGTLSRIEGNPAPDHVKGVQEGDATYLNTRRHVYATFYNRVKQAVAQHWNPNSVYRRRDPYGNIYGVRDRHTTLSVILTKAGKLTKVSVLRSSGLSFLDLEAVRAFRQAQPFPNPPQGMLSKDGRIRFKFGFFLQISSRPRMILFR